MSHYSKPLFVYGTLCARRLLAWVITGDAFDTPAVDRVARPGKVAGYKRFSVRDCDYPVAVPSQDKSASMDGLLLVLENESQRIKVDDFEGETFGVKSVSVTLDTGEVVQADMYIWLGEAEKLSTEEWDLDSFEKERLQDWLDLFEGMELVGDGWT